jgi:hypothetical protein
MEKTKTIDKKEEKYRRMISLLANMNIGQTITVSKISRLSKIHPWTGQQLLEYYDSLKEIGIEIVRDDKEKILFIKRTNESLDTKKELGEIKKKIIDLDTKIAEINSKLDKK